MKPKTVFTIAVICFFVIGCKSKIAMDYNDMIVKKQKNLGTSMDQAEPNLKNYFASYAYDSIAGVSSRMEAKIDLVIRDIKNTPAPKVRQGENFKKAAISYFVYVKSIYTSYKNYGLQTTPEGRKFQLQVMSTVISQEDNAIAEMQEAQRIFAKDNGFKIQSEKKSKNRSLTASPANQ
ncbi:MAG: hypothetical protein ACHQF0_03055 [Chitinophagales bacterium]